VGINPADRTPNRATRRYLARRDQGCTHPLCTQRRWLHAHHIVHWTDNGPTEPANLLLLCPQHHRALHHGEFRIEGDPEAGTVRFLDPFDRPIQPPDTSPPGTDPPGGAPPGGAGPRTDPSCGASPGGPSPGGVPRGGAPPPEEPPPGPEPSPFTPPLAESLPSDSFTWN
jgi:hypothetical protein